MTKKPPRGPANMKQKPTRITRRDKKLDTPLKVPQAFVILGLFWHKSLIFIFDTKSSAKEHGNLRQFITKNAEPLRYFQVYTKIVGFNADSAEEIRTGFKNKIDLDQAMTGQEFCDLLGLEYQSMLNARALDRQANFDRLVKDLAQIPEATEILKLELCYNSQKFPG